MFRLIIPILSLSTILLASTVEALISQEPVSKLLSKHADSIGTLKQVCQEKLGPSALESLPYSNDVFFLRYCIEAEKKGDFQEQRDRLEKTLDWRTGSGKSICDAATAAIQQATSGSSGWSNDGVLKAAPHAATITKFVTPSNVITTTSNQNDLVYCIRAGAIDDVSLMSQVSIPEMVDFFLYAKEVNAQVANLRSIDQDKVVCVITANDLAGVKLVGGSSDFRKALSQSSNQANELYPATNGPTLLLNLPKILSALVKLFTPLFSPEVKARLKFCQGPLSDVSDLTQVASPASSAERAKFVKELDEIIYN